MEQPSPAPENPQNRPLDCAGFSSLSPADQRLLNIGGRVVGAAILVLGVVSGLVSIAVLVWCILYLYGVPWPTF